MRKILLQALELQEKKLPHVLVTLIRIRGEAPSDLGAKMLVTSEGLYGGTVGGGKVEARAIEYSKDFLLDKNEGSLLCETWNLQTDIGMTCGGEVRFLFERIIPSQWNIAVFGAGHVAQALVRVLVTLDCAVQCIDSRAEWIEKLEDHPHLTKLVSPQPVERVPFLAPGTFLISMTQGHAFDVPILEAAFKTTPPLPYIGVIGSAQKAMRIKMDLGKLGIPLENLEKLRCPIGLPIGSNEPSEIAISVAAELLEVREVIFRRASTRGTFQPK